ncbi:hypothetical protein FRC02_004836 [Tulasnella sp. 418]|nr:hypothetical protein FRC02_004836 [Tulasnella sp. 418]
MSTSVATKVFDKRPIRKLATAAGACSAAGAAYGKCISDSYQDVQKGMCAAEFKAFKECVQKVMGRKW